MNDCDSIRKRLVTLVHLLCIPDLSAISASRFFTSTVKVRLLNGSGRSRDNSMPVGAFVVALAMVCCTATVFSEARPAGPPDAPQRRNGLAKSSSTVSSSFTYTFVKVLENGPWKNRVNMVYATDGYTESELPKAAAYVDSQIQWRNTQYLYARPFPRYANFFNFYRIDVVSQESGMSFPGSRVNNALGATFDGDRVAYINDSKGNALVSQVQKEEGITFNWKTAIINADKYANSGEWIDDGKGRGIGWTVFCYPQYGDICLHEGGHTFSHLADEYGGNRTDNTEYGEINSTHSCDGSKWGHWIGYKDIDPKLWSSDGVSDTVGYYQGSRYANTGQYRPTFDSRMNETAGKNRPPFSFNIVCREKIVHDIYNIVQPIDTLMDTTGQTTDPDSVWVQVIDPHVIHVDWYVNDELKKTDGGTSLSLSDIATDAGTYIIKAHVYDECIRHMYSDNKNPDTLDIVRKDTTKLVQDARWTVKLTNVAVSRAHWTRSLYSFSYNRNTVVYSLDRPAKVMLSLIKMNGVCVKTVSVKGNAGRNRIRFFKRSESVPPGVYLLKLTGGMHSRIIPVMFR